MTHKLWLINLKLRALMKTLIPATTALSCLIVKYAEEWVASGSIIYFLVTYEVGYLLKLLRNEINLIQLVNRVAGSFVYLSASALHFRVAQPDIGATFITLLNSCFNLGGVWVETISLKVSSYIGLVPNLFSGSVSWTEIKKSYPAAIAISTKLTITVLAMQKPTVL